jgi:PKD repeat protein
MKCRPTLRHLLPLLVLIFSFQGFSQTNATLSVTTDCWGGETGWSIYGSTNNLIDSSGFNTYGNQTQFDIALILPDDCYVLNMYDSYGDGLAGSIWGGCGVDGDYSITDEFGNVMVQMTEANFGNGVSHYFSVPFGAAGCTDIEALNYDPCAATDDGSCTYPPITADFSITAGSYCAGTTVQFDDLSIGNPVAWTWDIQGGTPSSSTDQNPSAVFDTAGTFSVTLTAENALGETSVLSQDVTINAGHTLEIIIVADNYPAETSWDLVDEFGNTVATGDLAGVGNGNTSTTVTCIEDNCHQWTINDSYGDGICCGYGQGSFELILDGVQVGSGGEFGASQTLNLNCPPGIDCNNPIDVVIGANIAPYPNSWFLFVPDTSGQWEITTCDLATCDTEIWVYDYCNMENFDDSNEATLTWNDDLCGVQAGVTPLLEEGVSYWLRIGDQGACGTDPIDFEVNFMGGVSGCMDPIACNYLPIAVEPETCYYPGDIQCESIGPDLWVLGDVLFNSMYFEVKNNNDACYIDEGCMTGFGDREIVRFTTHIKNIGTEDYFIGDPADQPDQFEWDPCHGHYHYEGYAEYVLFDPLGNEMPEIGFKNGFCVLDLECSDGGQAKYGCGNMGITAGCGDYYNSGLSCQWVDLTNVPAGSYTMMVRTNWDESPDANGSYELSYDNNWAVVCIAFDRDVDGNLINFTKTQDCGIPFDCLGVPFGNAQPDCFGNCPGIVVTGDLNNSGDLTTADVDVYVSDVLGNDGLATVCTDLNNDGDITVTDAAVAAGCVYYGPDHLDEFGVHDHCIWEDEVINTNETVTLSIGDVDQVNGYVDVHVLNPDNELVGFEFTVSGITIQSVENLWDPLVFDITPQAALGGTKVVGLAYDDQVLPKNLTPAPLFRIYYFSATGPDVCVSQIIDIVNDDYHNTLTAIGPCLPIAGEDFTDFTSTATTICEGESVSFQDLSTNGVNNWSWNFPGGTPASSGDQNPVITYNVPGVYDVTLTADNGNDTDAETKAAYITVLANATWYADEDGDTYGNALDAIVDCVQPSGYVDNNLDCDDDNSGVNPASEDICDNLDNDCNGAVDDDPANHTTWFLDSDSDGFGDDANTTGSCNQPAGYVAFGGDCDDSRDDVFPGANGTQEDIDNDCNGVVEGDEVSYCMGDLNGDSTVDVSDLLDFLAAYGCMVDCGDADMDGDGMVTSADLLLFLPAYGTDCP